MTGITTSEYPTLSIIVPTYNRLSTLRRCIQHIRANVSVAHELIVVEGGSTDGTREFLARHNRLRVIHEAKREGSAPARDKGFRAARGAYVMWLDDRAYPLPGSVEAAIAEMQREDGVGMVGFYDNCDCGRTVRDSVQRDGQTYRIHDVGGCVHANFGLLSRAALADIAHAGHRPIDSARAHPSLRIQQELGLRVIGCRSALIHQQPIAKRRRSEFRAPLSREAQEAISKCNKASRDETLQPALQQHNSDELQLA